MLKRKKRYTLEKDVPFAKSVIWDIQRSYYADSGINAWNKSGTVPHYVSSNPTVAYSYAEIALGFFRDRSKISPDNTDPIYFLELGAGSGRFAYHFIKQFSDLYDQLGIKLPSFCYVITDLSPHNVEYWKNHPRFQPYITSGRIDFAQFDATSTDGITLDISGKTLHRDSLTQPLIVIGNYFFDSIEQEFLYFRKGRVYDCMTTTISTINPKRAETKDLIKALELEYNYTSRKLPLYDMPELNHIISTYQAEIANSHIYIPTAGIRCLDYLRTLSQKGLLLLTADKSQHKLVDLDKRGASKLVTHGGSFSLTVNYHAIGQYVEQIGGACLFPEQPYYGLNHSVFLLLSQSQQYTETYFAYSRFINQFGPDDFFSIKKHIDQSYPLMSIRHILGYLRMSHYDSHLFLALAEYIHEQLEDISPKDREGLYKTVHNIWDLYYFIGEEKDLAFEIGMILYELDFYGEALAFFQQSITTHDVDIATLFNMAVCSLQVGDIKQATQLVTQVLADNPSYEPAIDLSQRIEAIVDELNKG